jgi:type VI protein secretion system component Hcp
MSIRPPVLASGIVGLVLFALPAPLSAATIMDFPEHPALKSQMPVLSYAFQRSAPPIARQCTGAGGGGSVTVTKPVDAATPLLAEVSQSKAGALVQLDDTKPDGTRIAFRFQDAKINAIAPSGEGEQKTEAISFTYSRVQWLTVGCQPRATARREIPSGPPAPSYGGGY